MFKIISKKTFEEKEKEIEERRAVLQQEIDIYRNLNWTLKNDLNDFLDKHIAKVPPEDKFIIKSNNCVQIYLKYKGVIYYSAKYTNGGEVNWKESSNIPKEVFKYFYENKKCD